MDAQNKPKCCKERSCKETSASSSSPCPSSPGPSSPSSQQQAKPSCSSTKANQPSSSSPCCSSPSCSGSSSCSQTGGDGSSQDDGDGGDDEPPDLGGSVKDQSDSDSPSCAQKSQDSCCQEQKKGTSCCSSSTLPVEPSKQKKKDSCCSSKGPSPASSGGSCNKGDQQKSSSCCKTSANVSPSSELSESKTICGGKDTTKSCCSSKKSSSCSSELGIIQMEYHQDSDYSDEVGAKMESDSCCSGGQCASSATQSKQKKDSCCSSKGPSPTSTGGSCNKGAQQKSSSCCKTSANVSPSSELSESKTICGGGDTTKSCCSSKKSSSCSSELGIIQMEYREDSSEVGAKIESDSCCSEGQCASSVPTCNAASYEKKMPVEPAKPSSWFDRFTSAIFGHDQESGKTGEKEPLLKSQKMSFSEEGAMDLTLEIGGMTCDGCAVQIRNFLESNEGIGKVSASVLTARGTLKYNPLIVTEQTILGMIRQLGFSPVVVPNSAESSFKMRVSPKDDSYALDKNIFCERLQEVAGVTRVSEDIIQEEPEEEKGTVWTIVYDCETTSTRALLKFGEAEGYESSIVLKRTSNQGSNAQSEVEVWKRYLILSFALALPVVYISLSESILGKPLWSQSVPGISCLLLLTVVQFLLASVIQFYIGKQIYERAWTSLYYGKRADMDVLIAASTSVAWGYSTIGLILQCALSDYEADLFYETSVILMTLIVLGRYLEIMAKGEASKRLTAIMSLQTPNAILLDEGDQSEEEVVVELICRNDLLKIYPGMVVPLDGVVVQGESAVVESMVTGEALPVTKFVGDSVIGGTINQDGVLIVRVTKIHSEGTLAQMHTLMEEAQHMKPKMQRIADRIASYFVPFIILLSIAIFVLWFLLCTYDIVEPLDNLSCLSFSLKFTITMLIISCPCAIALAAPTPLVVASGMAAKFGILIKSSITFETLQKVDTLILDKTGTMTYGKLSVVAVGVIPTVEMDNFLWLSGSAETGSEHPIGKAIADYAREVVPSKGLTLPSDFEIVRGSGIQCVVQGETVRIGSSVWLDGDDTGKTAKQLLHIPSSEGKTFHELEMEGLSLIFVEINHVVVGYVALGDIVRPHAACLLQACNERGIEVFMLSGDSEAAVKNLGKSLGMDDSHCLFRHTPPMKSQVIERLQNEEKRHRVVAFVGDGINDSIALAQADIGISVSEGTTIAIEAADVVLMRDDVWLLVTLIDLARMTYRVIKINFIWAFVYNSMALPLSGGLIYPFTGFQLPPFFAGFAEIFSSLPVIGISLLLKYYDPGKHSEDQCIDKRQQQQQHF